MAFEEDGESPEETTARLKLEAVIWETMPVAARQCFRPGDLDPLGFAICFAYWWDFETDTWKEPTPLPSENIVLKGGGVGIAKNLYDRFVKKAG